MNVMIPADDGHWVSEHHNRIAQLIKEYDSKLDLVWIPPEDRGERDRYPFAIMHTNSEGKQYIIFHLTEADMDGNVLVRLYQSDLNKNDVYANMEAAERAERDLRNKEYADKAAERRDLVRAIVANNKSTFKHNGKVYPT